ncbi:MAG: antitoxin [Myxococcota bacterium]
MRTTLTLTDDVYEAAKTLAAASGKSLGAVISETARRGLKPQRRVARTPTDLPSFEVSSKAEVIPGNRAGDLLAEEGLE